MEENPNNPERENDIFVEKNDISKKKKSIKGFDTLEQIASPENPDPFSRNIEEDEVEDNEVEKTQDESYAEFLEDVSYEKKAEEMKIEQLTTDIKMYEGKGATSVGPDIEGRIISGEAEEEFKHIEVDPVSVNPGMDSMNPYKNMSSMGDVKKFEKNDKQKASGKDNLKTIPKNKKERGLRGIIRNILGMQIGDASKKQKRENDLLEPYNKDEEAA